MSLEHTLVLKYMLYINCIYHELFIRCCKLLEKMDIFLHNYVVEKAFTFDTTCSFMCNSKV